MKPAWDDVNARARGLGTRLLGSARLSRLRSASSLNELVTELEREGYPLVPWGASPTAFELERSIRRNAQQHLAILARWCGARSRFLRFVFEDEDRRSLRALLRGAVEGVSSERRLSGLVPTPSLGERALEELSRLSSPSEIAATLTAWGSPYGESILAAASKTPVDLFALDLRVNRVFAARAMRGVRWRGRELREITRETIDLENALAAIVLCRHASGVEPEVCFIEGGRRLGIERFSEAARSGNLEPLTGAFAATPFARVFRESGRSISDIELVLFRERLRSYVLRARREPLSVATIFAHVLRVRAEAIDLRQIAWSLAFGAPPSAQDLVSVQ